MDRINLMPAERINAHKLRRRRLRWWSACGAYDSCALTLAPALSEVGAGARELEAQQQRLQRDIEIAARSNAELVQQHAQLMRQSGLIHELRGRADWGRLLGAVAQVVGADVALERMALAPAPDGRRGYRLRLEGMAMSQQAVNTTALQLERLKAGDSALFDGVTIEESRRQQVGERTSISFRIDCVLREAEPEK
ncbi:MAG: hypothetical protein ACF8R7_09280 [Phycisphaerales bacterium JB039]